mmetsp:Transcript_23734/g.77165  ORF Transcript_23734/g.77165 Transcript_23734/m.77165 type:complete len:217 (+) Transcript_23734:218-868(+)
MPNSAAADRSSGTARIAPEPSPRRSPNLSGGIPQPASESAASSAVAPRSADSCERKSAEATPGSIRTAASAAAPLMKPSTTTATPFLAASRAAPTIAASSNPPTARSHPSAPSLEPTAAPALSARPTAAAFSSLPSSFKPVPAPAASSGGTPARAERIAADAVVFPSPSSPSAIICAPERDTAAAPAAIAAAHSSALMAGSTHMSRVPRRTLAWCT